MKKNTIVLRAASGLLACAFAGLAVAAPQVEVFTPRGEAKGVRQVAVRFTEPMVAFGDPRLADPFALRCEGDAARLKGRWADSRNWAYDFECDLPAGQRCTFTLRPEVKSLSGVPLAGEREFSFHTGGPAVMTSLPSEGNTGIDDEQWFLLAFDAPVNAASLVGGAWCEASGVNERIPLKLLSDVETRRLVEANRESAFRLYRAYLKGRRAIPLAQFRIEDKRWKNLPVLGVRCSRRLPSGAEASLVIGESVRTQTGIARGQPQRLAFGVRPQRLPVPEGLVRQSVAHSNGIEPQRDEWFLAGTESALVTALDGTPTRPRILSPANGAVLALDPDIPPARQRLAIAVAGARPGARLLLDSRATKLADAPILWLPALGRHTLRLVDEKGAEFDRVQITVRGLALRRAALVAAMENSP